VVEVVAAVRKFFAIEECAQRWGSSRWTITRLADKGLIKTLPFGSRRLIPAAEVERIEREGLPASPRKSKSHSTPTKKGRTDSGSRKNLRQRVVAPVAVAQMEAR